MRDTWLTVSILGGLLIAAAIVAVIVWRELAGITISLHGMIAMAAGSIVTLLLGVGLMWLVYYSHKSGHDDKVGRDD